MLQKCLLLSLNLHESSHFHSAPTCQRWQKRTDNFRIYICHSAVTLQTSPRVRKAGSGKLVLVLVILKSQNTPRFFLLWPYSTCWHGSGHLHYWFVFNDHPSPVLHYCFCKETTLCLTQAMHLFSCSFTRYFSQILQFTLPQAIFLYHLSLAVFTMWVNVFPVCENWKFFQRFCKCLILYKLKN